MTEWVEPLPGVDITWEPNAPEAVLISDDYGRGALALKAHPADPDRRVVLLRFDLVVYSAMTPPNDEGLGHHPLYERGLKDLLWLGVVRNSGLVSRLRPSWPPAGEFRLEPLHFIAPLKECVVEVLAADVEDFRFDGTPREACLAALDPDAPFRA